MPQISRRASSVISLVLSAVTLAAIVTGAFFMPRITAALCGTKLTPPDAPFYLSYAFVLAVAYLILTTAAVCDLVLLTLLIAIRRGEVFTPANVARIRAVSWICIVAALLFAVLTPKFHISAAVAFVTFFVGLCLRIVKNAFEEAVALKEENDYTI